MFFLFTCLNSTSFLNLFTETIRLKRIFEKLHFHDIFVIKHNFAIIILYIYIIYVYVNFFKWFFLLFSSFMCIFGNISKIIFISKTKQVKKPFHFSKKIQQKRTNLFCWIFLNLSEFFLYSCYIIYCLQITFFVTEF